MNYKATIYRLALPTWSGKGSPQAFVKNQEIEMVKPVTQFDADLNEDVTANPGEKAVVQEVSDTKIALKFPDYTKLFYVEHGDIKPAAAPAPAAPAQQAPRSISGPVSIEALLGIGTRVETLIAKTAMKTGESVQPGAKGSVVFSGAGKVGVKFDGLKGLIYFTNENDLKVIGKPKPSQYATQQSPATNVGKPKSSAEEIRKGDEVSLKRTIKKRDGSILRAGDVFTVKWIGENKYSTNKIEITDPFDGGKTYVRKEYSIGVLPHTGGAQLTFINESDLERVK